MGGGPPAEPGERAGLPGPGRTPVFRGSIGAGGDSRLLEPKGVIRGRYSGKLSWEQSFGSGLTIDTHGGIRAHYRYPHGYQPGSVGRVAMRLGLIPYGVCAELLGARSAVVLRGRAAGPMSNRCWATYPGMSVAVVGRLRPNPPKGSHGSRDDKGFWWSEQPVVIVGGVAGGMSAATRLRRLDADVTITVLERSGHVSFANCGLPYFVGASSKRRTTSRSRRPNSSSIGSASMSGSTRKW